MKEAFDPIHEVESNLLNGEHIYFISDNADIGKLDKNKVVYRLSELKSLIESNFQGEDLKRIHFAKKIFDGTIK